MSFALLLEGSEHYFESAVFYIVIEGFKFSSVSLKTSTLVKSVRYYSECSNSGHVMMF